MITKLTKIVDNSPMGVHNVRGYESAKLVINVKSITGERIVGVYVSRSSDDPTIANENRADMYINGEEASRINNYVISDVGVYEFLINTGDVNKLQIAWTDSSSAEIVSEEFFSTSLDKLNINGIKVVPAKIISNKMGVHNVRGYESAKLVINLESIASGTRLIGIYKSHTTEDPTTERAEAYVLGRLITGNIPLSVGKTEVYIDIADVTKISIIASGGIGVVMSTLFSTSLEKLDVDKIASKKEVGLHRGGEYTTIPLTFESKQLDFEVDVVALSGIGYLRLEGSNDNGVTYSPISFIDNENLTHNYLGYQDISLYNKIVGFTNVEGYDTVRLRLDSSTNTRAYIRYSLHDRYITRVMNNIALLGSRDRSFFKGYRYIEYDFTGSLVSGGNYRQNFNPLDEGGNPIKYELYDRAMNPIPNTYYGRGDVIEIYGEVASGGVIMECDKPIDKMNDYLTPYTMLTGGTTLSVIKRTFHENRPEKKEFPLVADKNDFQIRQLPSLSIDKDVFNADVLEYTASTLSFYMYGYYGIRYDIPFTVDNVPSLKSGEQIKFAYLLPFTKSTRGAVGTKQAPSRIVVFTTENRVLHNFPFRANGSIPNSDLFLFDESEVINTNRKWLPVKNKSKVDAIHKYFPVLKNYNYDQFEGRVAGTAGFIDHFGSGGLREGIMYHDERVAGVNMYNTLAYSNLTKGEKITAFGNYNVSAGAEPFVMVTNNGGRRWYVQSWFACTDNYSSMHSGSIDLDPITSISPFVSGSLKMCRKRFNIPTLDVKEPETPFIVNEEDKSLVTGFSLVDGETVVTLADNVDYDGVLPIVYFENVSADSEWDYICNNGFSEDGESNNGIFFRAEKISPNQYKLLCDLGNPYEGDQVCRHIHAVNTTSSGITISTGESYWDNIFEGGFLYFLQQNYRNGGNILPSINLPMPVLRLTSTKEGVNRACGAYIFNDDVDPTLLYVSDEAYETISDGKRYAQIPDRTIQIKNTPSGIFIGKLSDIDDQSKFTGICESPVTLIGLTEHHGHFVAEGHRYALMISKDGKSWSVEDNNYPCNRVNGTDAVGNIYFGNKVIVFK